MGRVLWLITVGLLAVAVHIAYVLFMPGLFFQKALLDNTSGKPDNEFFVMAPESQARVMPSASADDVVGLCKYDLGKGKVVLSTQLPHSYWTLSIFTQSGRQIYSLDDVQAGSSSFTVDLTKAPSIFEQLLAKNDGEDTGGQVENLGWKVESNERRGLALIWIPLADPLMRGEVEKILNGSRCEAKRG
jgi:uncharacterized membrane protein